MRIISANFHEGWQRSGRMISLMICALLGDLIDPLLCLELWSGCTGHRYQFLVSHGWSLCHGLRINL